MSAENDAIVSSGGDRIFNHSSVLKVLSSEIHKLQTPKMHHYCLVLRSVAVFVLLSPSADQANKD